jgi:hypothetical protein
MALTADQENVLKLASRFGVRKAAARLPAYWAADAWLPDRNKYAKASVHRLKREYDSAKAIATSQNVKKSNAPQFWKPTHAHMADYVAASTATHCMDGWSYLGQAINAELSGAPDLARHLGYYAELRAAMSLLAGDGIGVFDTHHVVVDGAGKCKMVPGSEGTHKFAWDALEFWSATAAAASTLQASIYPGGIALSEWLAHFPGTAGFVATTWLKQWGLDLSRLADDRDARNLASYRPTAFTSPGPTDVTDSLDAVTSLWDVCSPEGIGGFPAMDRHLLRHVVEILFTSANGATRRQAPKKYLRDVGIMMHGVAPLDRRSDWWLDFLTFQSNAEVSTVIREAEGTAKPTNPDHSKQVLARATLLLRVATGSVSNLLADSISPSGLELEFWWSSDSIRRRLWETDQPPQAFADLWTDVEEAMTDLLSWRQATAPTTHMHLWHSRAKEAASLTTTERVALWGLRL